MQEGSQDQKESKDAALVSTRVQMKKSLNASFLLQASSHLENQEPGATRDLSLRDP